MDYLPNISFFSNKFSENSGHTAKDPFRKMIDKKLEKIFTERDQWKFNKSNNNWGIVIDDFWDNRNTMNTHSGFCWFLCREVNKYDSTILDNIGFNRWDKVFLQLDKYIDDNVDKIFPVTGKTSESREIDFLLSRSWNSGNLSTIDAVYGIKLYNPNITKLEYGFKKGDKKDMNGVDMVSFLDDKPTTYQLKSGYHNGKCYNNYYYVNGSTNTLKYSCDQYIYTKYDAKTNEMSCLIFKNVRNDNQLLTSIKSEYGTSIKVHKDLIKFDYKGHMSIPEKLHQLAILLNDKKWTFTITGDGEENNIKLEKNEYGDYSVHLNFVNPDDENLEGNINKVLEELKNLLQ